MIRVGVCCCCDESQFLFSERGVAAFEEWHDSCCGEVDISDGMPAYRVVVRRMYREALDAVGV